jgi:hypothetical protein
MKITVEKYFGEWNATATQGCQKFHIGYGSDDKQDAEFMAKMFRIALKRHDKAKAKGGK